MCSYKLVTVKFEVWGLQTRVEQFVHKVRMRENSVNLFFMWSNFLTRVDYFQSQRLQFSVGETFCYVITL